MVNSPRGGGARRTTSVRVSAGAGCRRSAHWALRGVTAGVLSDRPPGPDPALLHRALEARPRGPRRTGDARSPDERAARGSPARIHEAGRVIATVGRYAVDDLIEAVEAAGLIDESREALLVGIGGDRYLGATVLPEPEGVEGG